MTVNRWKKMAGLLVGVSCTNAIGEPELNFLGHYDPGYYGMIQSSADWME